MYILFYSFASQSKMRIILSFQSVKFLCKADPDWGPAKKEHQAERRALDCLPGEQLESTLPLYGTKTSGETGMASDSKKDMTNV